MSLASRDREKRKKSKAGRQEISGERQFLQCARQILDQTEGEGGGGGLCCRLSTISTSQDSLKASASRKKEERTRGQQRSRR